MSNEDRIAEPSSESLTEIPEVDFSGGIRPNRYANLRGDFQHAVFLDRDLWEHFGSEQRVIEVLQTLVELAEGRGPGHAA
jgi:hypothetical protein